MRFLDLYLGDCQVSLCGNYGDPIYHPDFVNLVAQLKSRVRGIEITTNGSYRDQGWWQQLLSVLDARDTIVFSVDGSPNTSPIYRENSDWISIDMAMQLVAKSSVTGVWKMIPFVFNEHEIQAVERMSTNLGLQFRLEPSDRFDDQTQHLRPSEQLLGSRYQAQQQWQQDGVAPAIKPKCNSGHEHYISAQGYYVPCCYLQDHRFYYKTQFAKFKDQYDISKTTLTTIMNHPSVIQFYDSRDSQAGCQFNCP